MQCSSADHAMLKSALERALQERTFLCLPCHWTPNNRRLIGTPSSSVALRA